MSIPSRGKRFAVTHGACSILETFISALILHTAYVYYPTCVHIYGFGTPSAMQVLLFGGTVLGPHVLLRQTYCLVSRALCYCRRTQADLASHIRSLCVLPIPAVSYPSIRGYHRTLKRSFANQSPDISSSCLANVSCSPHLRVDR